MARSRRLNVVLVLVLVVAALGGCGYVVVDRLISGPPDVRSVSRSAAVAAASRAADRWISDQFEYLSRELPWLENIGRAVLDSCGTPWSGYIIRRWRAPECQREVRYYFAVDGDLCSRAGRLFGALQVGWRRTGTPARAHPFKCDRAAARTAVGMDQIDSGIRDPRWSPGSGRRQWAGISWSSRRFPMVAVYTMEQGAHPQPHGPESDTREHLPVNLADLREQVFNRVPYLARITFEYHYYRHRKP